ncbi:hypothetical protein B0I37DRAFT_217229 [Chaetomium sp. MPI-CAGE-AT-0009]|nr:hypothetical protein B0I37DRAFT_217229 [Chaetomium sp. MPI-CAGE-AT-0009]
MKNLREPMRNELRLTYVINSARHSTHMVTPTTYLGDKVEPALLFRFGRPLKVEWKLLCCVSALALVTFKTRFPGGTTWRLQRPTSPPGRPRHPPTRDQGPTPRERGCAIGKARSVGWHIALNSYEATTPHGHGPDQTRRSIAHIIPPETHPDGQYPQKPTWTDNTPRSPHGRTIPPGAHVDGQYPQEPTEMDKAETTRRGNVPGKPSNFEVTPRVGKVAVFSFLCPSSGDLKAFGKAT